MGAFGPLEDEDGNPIMVEVNYIDFIDSSKTVIITNEDEMRKVLEDESN
ncbi:hypothetical protein [Niallia circulans]|nr:hypothetical protein [Niallia circulans]